MGTKKHVRFAEFELRAKRNVISDFNAVLTSENKEISAHKYVLESHSIYFQNIFAENKTQSVICMDPFPYKDLAILIALMYNGEVVIPFETDLRSLYDTKESLQINKKIQTYCYDETFGKKWGLKFKDLTMGLDEMATELFFPSSGTPHPSPITTPSPLMSTPYPPCSEDNNPRSNSSVSLD